MAQVAIAWAVLASACAPQKSACEDAACDAGLDAGEGGTLEEPRTLREPDAGVQEPRAKLCSARPVEGGDRVAPEDRVDGASISLACGFNDRGLQMLRCSAGTWLVLPCQDPDAGGVSGATDGATEDASPQPETGGLMAGHCRSTDDCEPELPVCEDDVCVQCVDDGHCLSGEMCRDNMCWSPCGQRGSCPASAPHCDVDSVVCVACLTDAHCGFGRFCDPATKACVSCVDDSHCAGARPVCASDTQTCVGCEDSSDCSETQDCCDRTCIDVQGADNNNCGACGVACRMTSDRCTAGTCTCNGAAACTEPQRCAGLFGFPPACGN